jgi:glycosyltransferase involved in cell wall biosynthesis
MRDVTMNENKYILITAAKNEEKYVRNTINSVISQTILPMKWIIIDDGSTDSTAEIIIEFKHNNPFIELINNGVKKERNFASQANLLNIGFDKIKSLDFDYVSTLDADITFEKDYYENIMKEFALNAKLGIGGGSFYELVENNWQEIAIVAHSVRGAVQFFRKQCFIDIGEKFLPLKYGGFDTVAEVLSRKNGWEVRTFGTYKVYHHRRTGTGGIGVHKARFRGGLADYSLGTHPVYEMFKFLNRLREKPYIIGSIYRLSGFLWAYLSRMHRQVSKDFILFNRKEQIERIKYRIINRDF